MGIKGVLAADIGQLSELQSLYVEAHRHRQARYFLELSVLATCNTEWKLCVYRDLSFNKDLSGVLTPTIGNLKQLTTL